MPTMKKTVAEKNDGIKVFKLVKRVDRVHAGDRPALRRDMNTLLGTIRAGQMVLDLVINDVMQGYEVPELMRCQYLVEDLMKAIPAALKALLKSKMRGVEDARIGQVR